MDQPPPQTGPTEAWTAPESKEDVMSSISTATVTTDDALSSSPSSAVISPAAQSAYVLQDPKLSPETGETGAEEANVFTEQPDEHSTVEKTATVVRKQPRKSSSSSVSSAMRMLNGRDKPLPEPVDGDAFFRGHFAEVFTIGGGTYWILSFFLFILEVLVLLKHAGIPAGGQLAAAFNAFLEAPLIGPLLKFAMCGSTRHSYKIATAIEDDHPTLKEQRPKLKEGDVWAAPSTSFFPQRYKGFRGTPEHHPITDFENALPANERGALWDLLFHGSQRGFKLRFKTGISKTGGQTVFTVTRKPPRGFGEALVEQAYGLVCRSVKSVTSWCPCCSSKEDEGSSSEVEVFDSSGNIVGRVRSSTQIDKCETFFRNRFNKKAYPLYDVLGPDGEIIYTLLVPIRQYKFLGCCCVAYEDLDFISIVPGPRDTTGRFGGAESPETLGWMLRLETRLNSCVSRLAYKAENCLKCLNIFTLGKAESCLECLKACQSCVTLARTCPVDNVTQVPHPGLDHLRCTYPCSHGMNAQRIRLPPGEVSARDRMLLTAAAIQIDMDNVYMTL